MNKMSQDVTTEAVVQTVSKLARLRSSHKVHLIAVGVIASAAGAVGGVLASREKLRAHYEEIAQQEVLLARNYYARTNKTEEFADPESALQALHPETAPIVAKAARAHRDYAGVTPRPGAVETGSAGLRDDPRPEIVEAVVVEEVPEDMVEEGVVVNAFSQERPVEEDDWDYDIEVPLRTTTVPYVIHHDEFYNNDLNYEQAKMTYWAEDDTLVDEQDHLVPEPDLSVGIENLQDDKFGHGSLNANIVYVRNDTLQVDFEVARSNGSYAREVHGFDIDEDEENSLRHSARRSSRKLRDD